MKLKTDLGSTVFLSNRKNQKYLLLISLATLLPKPFACMKPGFWGLLLCKPQFEAGPERVAKGGVVRDDDVRQQVVDETVAAVGLLGVDVVKVVEAHPPGPKGNIEYVLYVQHVS